MLHHRSGPCLIAANHRDGGHAWCSTAMRRQQAALIDALVSADPVGKIVTFCCVFVAVSAY
jgi:hypothetical protein